MLVKKLVGMGLDFGLYIFIGFWKILLHTGHIMSNETLTFVLWKLSSTLVYHRQQVDYSYSQFLPLISCRSRSDCPRPTVNMLMIILSLAAMMMILHIGIS